MFKNLVLSTTAASTNHRLCAPQGKKLITLFICIILHVCNLSICIAVTTIHQQNISKLVLVVLLTTITTIYQQQQQQQQWNLSLVLSTTGFWHLQKLALLHSQQLPGMRFSSVHCFVQRKNSANKDGVLQKTQQSWSIAENTQNPPFQLINAMAKLKSTLTVADKDNSTSCTVQPPFVYYKERVPVIGGPKIVENGQFVCLSTFF